MNDDTKRTVLHYPTIGLPDRSWVAQALLYWDEIATIVPKRLGDIYAAERADDSKLFEDVEDAATCQYLFAEKVLRPILPEHLVTASFDREDELQGMHWGEFGTELKSIVHSTAFKALVASGDRTHSEDVHVDKVSDSAYHLLKSEDLISGPYADRDGYWFKFERTTYFTYMSLLAHYLAELEEGLTLPATSYARFESLVLDARSPGEGFLCLDARFLDALPSPHEDTPLEAVLEFKRREENRDALLRFRSLFDSLHVELGMTRRLQDVSRILLTFKERVERGASELADALSAFAIETVTGTLKTVVSLKSPAVYGTAAILTTKATRIADIPLRWAIPGIAIAGGIEVWDHLVHRRNRRRAILRESDFSYLYMARESGLI